MCNILVYSTHQVFLRKQLFHTIYISVFNAAKVTVTLIPYSQHVSAIHGHGQVSVAMLKCCAVLHVII
jgi:hypothetical protein